MRLNILFSLLISILFIYFISIIVTSGDAFFEFYSKNIRSSLFTGFLTLGGFLFSLKTFIIVKMKENVYDDKKYLENLERQRKLNPNISHYGPLKRLSDLLFFSILSSIITAASQFSIGLYKNQVSAYVCIFLSIFTLTLFIVSLIIIKRNLDTWFKYLEN